VITTLTTTDIRRIILGKKSRLVAGKAGGKKRKARLIKEIAVARTRTGNFYSIDKSDVLQHRLRLGQRHGSISK
jgi:hypothetical protein